MNEYQQTVRARYPQAEAQHHRPIHQMGQATPYQSGGWAIYTGPSIRDLQLGSGATEEIAWREAAKKVQAEAGADQIAAMAGPDQLQYAEQQNSIMQQTLEERKIIERAKGIMMKRLGVSEEEVFRRMRKVASASNSKLVEVTQQIIAAEKFFSQFEEC